jgi:hypothetical protein
LVLYLRRYGDRIQAFLAWLAFILGTALLALLAEPPAVIVAIVAVIVVGVLVTSFLPRSLHSRWRTPAWLASPPVGPPAPEAPPLG